MITPASEYKTDLELLVECVKCQLDNPAALKQAFFTIADICNQQGTIIQKVKMLIWSLTTS